MIIFVENRQLVVDGYKRRLSQAGECLMQVTGGDLVDWLMSIGNAEISAIEAVLIGECDDAIKVVGAIRSRLDCPVLAMLDNRSLEMLTAFFQHGADDVVVKPVHCDELRMRIAAIKKRILAGAASDRVAVEDDERGWQPISLFFDGNDPLHKDEPLVLPRRERRILEYLASINGRRATKSQIFCAIYGLLDDQIEENVIESHISKLRKKLKELLGCDPIDSKRYLGYRLDPKYVAIHSAPANPMAAAVSAAQPGLAALAPA